MRIIVAILISLSTINFSSAQVSYIVDAGIMRSSQVIPAVPLNLRSSFEAPAPYIGYYLSVTAESSQEKRLNPGIVFRISQEGSGKSSTWSTVDINYVHLGPTLTYNLTPILAAFGTLGGTYSFRENIREPRFINPQGSTSAWDLRMALGLRGNLGRFRIECAAERGIADTGGSILVQDASERRYLPGYYITNLRFGVGYTFSERS